MKIVYCSVTTVLALASWSVSPAFAQCGYLRHEFSGTFEPAFRTSNQPSQLRAFVSPNGVVVSLGSNPEIAFESKTSTCSSAVISGHFEDNWGNTGKYILHIGDHPSIELTDIETPAQIERNTIGAYPEKPVQLLLLD